MLSVVHCSSDFKTNEKKIMKELDQLAASTGKGGGKAADLGGAMEGTEEIRQWVSFMHFLLCVTSYRKTFGINLLNDDFGSFSPHLI